MVSGSMPDRCESIKKNDVVQQNAILWSLFFQMDGVYPNRWLANVAKKWDAFADDKAIAPAERLVAQGL